MLDWVMKEYADLIPFVVVWSGCCLVGIVYIAIEILRIRRARDGK